MSGGSSAPRRSERCRLLRIIGTGDQINPVSVCIKVRRLYLQQSSTNKRPELESWNSFITIEPGEGCGGAV